jgi:PIN domain nuclease of toxin-antitoxin system
VATDIAIADITLFELAMLEKKGRISLTCDFFDNIEARFVVVAVDSKIAATAAELALPQGDPFDRLIVATALVHELVLVTRDVAIVESRMVKTLW